MVLSILHSQTLVAKMTKCEFGRTEIGYLRHKISMGGVLVDPDKIVAIRGRPLSASLKSLRGFLGLTGYYRKFVHWYSSIATPLMELLHKNSFVWLSTAMEPFQQLK